MSTKFRVAFCMNMAVWSERRIHVQLHSMLSDQELSTLTITKATGIFYTNDPFLFMNNLFSQAIPPEDFNWINISVEK